MRYPRKQVRIGSHIFRAEVADSVFSRARGLSGRSSLAEDEAMFFVFSLPWRYSFWMKGMKFPLDIIWIRKGRVVDISEDVPAPVPGASIAKLINSSAKPKVAVDAVLEVNAGTVRRFGIKTGDIIE